MATKARRKVFETFISAKVEEELIRYGGGTQAIMNDVLTSLALAVAIDTPLFGVWFGEEVNDVDGFVCIGRGALLRGRCNNARDIPEDAVVVNVVNNSLIRSCRLGLMRTPEDRFSGLATCRLRGGFFEIIVVFIVGVRDAGPLPLARRGWELLNVRVDLDGRGVRFGTSSGMARDGTRAGAGC